MLFVILVVLCALTPVFATSCANDNGLTANSGTCKCGDVYCYGSADVGNTVTFIANIGPSSNDGGIEVTQLADFVDVVCPSTVDKTKWLSSDTYDDTFTISITVNSVGQTKTINVDVGPSSSGSNKETMIHGYEDIVCPSIVGGQMCASRPRPRIMT